MVQKESRPLNARKAASSQKGKAQTNHASLVGFLAGGGEMGEHIRAKDWSETPLGLLEEWPQSLLTLVATSIRSRFPIVMWWDRHHYTMLYNDAYIPFLGKTKHPGWLGRSGKDCWHEIWPIVGPMLESVFETGEPTWSEDLLLVMDRNLPQEETYFTFSYSAIPGATGAVEGIFCACTETTERVIGERRLRTLRDLASSASQARSAEEACELAARLFDRNATDIPFALIYLLDRDHRVAHLAASSGLPSESLSARDMVLLQLPGEAVDPWSFDEVARTGKPVLINLLPGEYATIEAGPWPEPLSSAVVVPLKGSGQNQVTGFLVMGVNPRRMFDESYQDFFQMVAVHVTTAVSNARAYEEERRRAEALVELDRAKTLFFSNISHEFRTPLTLMLGPIQDLLVGEKALSLTQRESIELLQRNASRLLRLVNMLLDFSRMEAGRMEAVYEPVDLAALTTDLAASFRSAIEKAGLTLRVECPPLPAPVYVDQQMWEKILLNLLSNAFKYTFEGTITVRMELQAQGVEVSVQDTGVGIPAEELPHMFERFHRIRGTQGRTYEGSGIGLSLVYELVKLHGGTIRVSSTPGQGSTFIVSLPSGSSHLPAERIAVGRTLPSTAASASTYVEESLHLLANQETVSGLLPDVPLPASGDQPSSTGTRADTGEQRPAARILFADDNADMREYVSRLLRQRYEVLVVSDGKAALTAAKEHSPDLVLADVMMPGMDGFELLQAIRADSATRGLPVILLSARAGEEARIEGIEVGADDYIIKPFSARELLARIGAHLEIARIRKEAGERIQAELRNVEESETRFRTLADNISQFAWMADETGWIFWYNQRWYDYTGTNLSEMEGWGWKKVHHPDHVGRVVEKIRHYFATGEAWEDTFPLRGKDGAYRWFLSRAIPIRDEQGKVIRWFGTNTDITEQKQLEQLKDDFIGIASHELKTPVTSLKAYAQLLERRFRQGGDARSAELLQKMDAQLNKLMGLIGDLLDVTKIVSGQLPFQLSSFDFNELVNEIVEETQRTTTRHTIIQELAASVTLSADRDRIGQVLTNLLTNAIKYSPQAETVVVKTVRTGDAIITSVQDFGIGIPGEKQQYIFERFFRVGGGTQNTYPGLGLGLYISAEFVKRHGGSIWVESEEGKGTTFSFSLPLRQAQKEVHS